MNKTFWAGLADLAVKILQRYFKDILWRYVKDILHVALTLFMRLKKGVYKASQAIDLRDSNIKNFYCKWFSPISRIGSLLMILAKAIFREINQNLRNLLNLILAKIDSFKVLRLLCFSFSMIFMYCISLSKAAGKLWTVLQLWQYYNCCVIDEKEKKLCLTFDNFNSLLTISDWTTGRLPLKTGKIYSELKIFSIQLYLLY